MSESEEEEITIDSNAVEIGHAVTLRSNFQIWDAGKVGGKPIWLNPRDLPKCEELICHSCKNPLKFLLQLYLPLDDDENCFHRSLYIFTCDKTSCVLSGGIKILRCQLRQENDFYPPQLIEEDEETKDDEKNLSQLTKKRKNENDIELNSKECKYNTHLCEVCGFPAPSRCSRCKSVYYCSKSHQLFHWKVCHQNECGKENIKRNEVTERILKDSLFKEYEIEITIEPYDAEKIKLENKKYEKLIKKEDKIKPEDKISEEDINEAMKSVGKNPISINPYFLEFQNRISISPSQIVRIYYENDKSILWYSDKCILSSSDIPKCQYCGNDRVYEFQVMPQILYYLGLNIGKDANTLQFGTLCVYTCSKNCISSEHAYLEEFIYCQPAEDI